MSIENVYICIFITVIYSIFSLIVFDVLSCYMMDLVCLVESRRRNRSNLYFTFGVINFDLKCDSELYL